MALKPSLTGILRGQLSLSGEYVLNNSFTAELELGLLHKNYLGDFIKDIEGGLLYWTIHFLRNYRNANFAMPKKPLWDFHMPPILGISGIMPPLTMWAI